LSAALPDGREYASHHRSAVCRPLGEHCPHARAADLRVLRSLRRSERRVPLRKENAIPGKAGASSAPASTTARRPMTRPRSGELLRQPIALTQLRDERKPARSPSKAAILRHSGLLSVRTADVLRASAVPRTRRQRSGDTGARFGSSV
jgi:hypothetical protein